MNGRANGRLNKTRITRTFHLAPTTRAIRAALAISMTVLALSGSGLALAETCINDTTPDTISCNGDFTGLPGGNFVPVADLTLILGDTAPTSVTPAPGTIGVDANWGGNVGVVSHAAITTAGADGIQQYGSTSANLNNNGAITTNVTAAGANAVDISAYGDVTVVNNGPINAYGTGVYDVTAVRAYSIHGKVSIDNQLAGTITAAAQDGNAIAVYSSAFGDDVVTNEGTITASSVNGIAVGVIGRAYNGNTSVTNSGSISATSSNYQAVGLLASSSNGYATIGNSGTITAYGGQDQAIGISASGALGSSIDNSGHVNTTSYAGEAIGISAQAYGGTASVTNSGTIHVANHGPYAAIGVLAYSANGQASIDNSGFVQSIADHGDGIGLEADAANGSTITNSNYVLAGSYTSNATGILATATSGDVVVNNTASGYIRTVTLGSNYFEAIGVSAHSAEGKVNVSNAGSILGFSLNGHGDGILAIGGGDVYVGNSGNVEGKSGYYGDATGIGAGSANGAVTVVNSGRVLAYSGSRLGERKDKNIVDGIRAVSHAGAYNPSTGTYGATAITTVVNSGYVKALGAWTANGIEAGSYGGTSVTNTASGVIYAGGVRARGIYVLETPNSKADYGVGAVTVSNAGSIRADQVGDCHCTLNPYAYGISVVSGAGGDIGVSNTGSIGINTEHGGSGIVAYGYLGETTVSNSGSIAVSGAGAQGFTLYGERVRSAYGGGSATNSGDITIVSGPVEGELYAGSTAKGMWAHAGRFDSPTIKGGGDAILVNTGQIQIDSAVGYGMWAQSDYALAQASNSGTIVVDDTFSSFGITANAGNFITPGEGSVLLDNSGSVSALASNQAIGLRAFTGGSFYLGQPGIAVAVDNSGYVGASSQQRSQGILAFSIDKDTFAIDNSGSVVVNTTVSDRTGQYAGASGAAVGIHTALYQADATITNSGDIVATTQENNQRAGSAAGIYAESGTPEAEVKFVGIGYGDTSITNTGSIGASLVSSNALAPIPPDPNGPIARQIAFGPFNTASGILSINTYGDVAIANSGTIAASAVSDHYAGTGAYKGVTTSNGIAAVSKVGNYNFTTTYDFVYNPVTHYYDKVYDGVASTFTLGDIALNTSAASHIAAYARSTDASGDTALANGISAMVSMGNYGGSLVSAGTGITIDNAGSVSATALVANDPTGIAIANGISAINESTAGFVKVTNSGNVNATATGSFGSATGLFASGASVTASNSGSLSATFVGAAGKAYGANLTSAGDLSFTNSGQIFAANVGDAVGVQLNSATGNTLVNSGLVSAASSAGNSIAVRTNDATASIQNTGIINGAIITGAGNDTLTNSAGAVWNALGTSTDFGTGDDTISNAGTINLHDSAITLGDGANAFTNSGTLTALGSNTIDMGAGNVFSNTGSVEMRNGIAGDALTLTGDWAGSGKLGLDVSGLHGTSDRLHIVGNVGAGSVTSVNLNLLDLPKTATGSVPVIDVTGDSTAGNFVLGDVHFDTAKSFLVVQAVNLTSVIDASNAKPDVFSVGVAVTGVTDSGALAASFVPGVQSLMASEVGTWRQRMGVLAPVPKGSVGLWTRAFSDSGTVNPGHSASNFGQGGHFSFDQTNSGEEIGADFAIADTFSAGLMLGKAQASQHLDNSGVGRNRISGDTRGIYATWMPENGFYLDGSYRTMSFDARLDSQAGESRSTGKADAFNLEAGQSWTIGDGFKIVPQLQYTRTTVNKAGTMSGALAGFTPQGGTSSRGRAGVALSKDIANGTTVWTPYASLSAVHEFDGSNGFTINNVFSGTTDTKGTSALVEGGLNIKAGKLDVFGGVNWQDGGALKSFAGGQVGLRYNW